jgi:hypothetical protein
MKRIFTLLTIALGSVSGIQSQVVLTYATHGFTSGLTHETIQVDYQEPGDAGTNLVWDFSQVNSLKKTGADAESTIGEVLSKNASRGNVAVSRNDQVSFLYNNTEKGNEYLGYESENMTVTFTEPLIKTKYPQSFGTYFEGNYSGNYTCQCGTAEQTNDLSGFYSTHADATGVLFLPGDIQLQALRVRTVEILEYPHSVLNTEHVKYLWYAQSERFPVFVSLSTYSVNKSTGERQLVGQTSYLNVNLSPAAPTGIASVINDSEIAYKVFPNPFRNKVEVSYSLPKEVPVSVELYNSRGLKLASLIDRQSQKGANYLSKDIAKYTQAPDIYILKLTFGDKVFTEKLIKEGK